MLCKGEKPSVRRALHLLTSRLLPYAQLKEDSRVARLMFSQQCLGWGNKSGCGRDVPGQGWLPFRKAPPLLGEGSPGPCSGCSPALEARRMQGTRLTLEPRGMDGPVLLPCPELSELLTGAGMQCSLGASSLS